MYNKELCVDGVLKNRYMNLKAQGLTHMVYKPKVFADECIIYVLLQVHDGSLWLDEEKPIKITKEIFHKVTRLSMQGEECPL